MNNLPKSATPVASLPEKEQPRIFAMGDIHGHYDELQTLFQTLRSEAKLDLRKDHLVLLGDLVDAGPKTKDVVQWCFDMKATWPETFHPLKGNHDDMFVDALKYDCARYSRRVWYDQGGEASLDSYVVSTSEDHDHIENNVVDIPEEHMYFLEALPAYWETDKYFFVHAGVPPISLDVIREEMRKEKPDPVLVDHLLWIRGDFYNSNFQWEKKIIFAHTPFESHKTGFWEPYVRDTMIGINTMPRNDGKLTAVELPEEKFYFQPKL
jgi:serine/threonine protein phosphatase 1